MLRGQHPGYRSNLLLRLAAFAALVLSALVGLAAPLALSPAPLVAGPLIAVCLG